MNKKKTKFTVSVLAITRQFTFMCFGRAGLERGMKGMGFYLLGYFQNLAYSCWGFFITYPAFNIAFFTLIKAVSPTSGLI